MTKGKPLSDEQKKNLSDKMKGRPSHFKGRTYEEIYGVEGGAKFRKKLRDVRKQRLGKTNVEIFGEEKAAEISQKIVNAHKRSIVGVKSIQSVDSKTQTRKGSKAMSD